MTKHKIEFDYSISNDTDNYYCKYCENLKVRDFISIVVKTMN